MDVVLGLGRRLRECQTLADDRLPTQSLSGLPAAVAPALPDESAVTTIFYLVLTVLYHFAKNYWLKSV